MASRYTAPNDYRAFCEMLEESHDSLAHHGIKGQKWGVRRFQNDDGTLTTAGKDRYSDDKKKISTSTKVAIGTGIATLGIAAWLKRQELDGDFTKSKKTIAVGAALVGTIFAGKLEAKHLKKKLEQDKAKKEEEYKKEVEAEKKKIKQIPERAGLDKKELDKAQKTFNRLVAYKTREKTGEPRENTKADYVRWDKAYKDYEKIIEPFRNKIKKEYNVTDEQANRMIDKLLAINLK